MAITSSFANLATVTRASKKTDAGGWDFTNGGTVGTLTEYASGVAAIHPTAGILIEEGSTNHIRNPRFEGGTIGVIGSGGALPTNMVSVPQGTTVELVAVGEEDGTEYMDIKWSGTPTADPEVQLESTTAISASVGEEWTLSYGAKLVAGDLTNITGVKVRMVERISGSYAGEGSVSFTPDSIHRRYVFTRTLANASVTNIHPYLAIDWDGSGAIDLTIRFYVPQMEEKAYPTSPILPTAASPAASTRAADSVAVANGSWSNDDGAGTIFAEFAFTYDGQASNFPRVLGYGADSSNRVDVYRNQATESLFALLSDGGATQASITTGTAPAATTKKVAVAWAADDVAFSVSGGTQQTDSSATIGFGAAVLRLGAGAGNTNASAGVYIKDLRYFPRRLSNAELEALVGN
jgi:hypothetical protein